MDTGELLKYATEFKFPNGTTLEKTTYNDMWRIKIKTHAPSGKDYWSKKQKKFVNTYFDEMSLKETEFPLEEAVEIALNNKR